MICWDRLGDGSVMGVFESHEIRRLRRLAQFLKNLLDAQAGDDTENDPYPDHDREPEFAERPDLFAAARFRHGDGDADDSLPSPSQDLLRTVRFMLSLMLATLPRHGGTVVLRSFDEVHAWLWLLTDLQVVTTELVDCAGESFLYDDLDDKPDHRYLTWVVDWLKVLAGTLYDTATKPIESVSGHLVDIINETPDNRL